MGWRLHPSPHILLNVVSACVGTRLGQRHAAVVVKPVVVPREETKVKPRSREPAQALVHRERGDRRGHEGKHRNTLLRHGSGGG